MPDGSYSPTASFDALLNGGPPAAATAVPAPAAAAPATPPAPSSPAPAPAPDQPYSPTAMFDALASGKMGGTPAANSAPSGTAAPPAQTGAVGNIFRREAASPDYANPDTGLDIMGGLANSLPATLPRTVGNEAIRGLNALFSSNIPQIPNPSPIQAPTEGDKLIQGGAEALGNSVPFAAGGAALEAAAPASKVAQFAAKNLLSIPGRTLPAIAAGGASGVAAQQAFPDHPVAASMAGNLVGGGGEALAQEGLSALGKGAVKTLGEFGVGPKQEVPVPGASPINATGGQIAQVTNRIMKAGGPKLLADLDKNPLQKAHDDLMQQPPTPEIQAKLADLKTAMAVRKSQYETVPGSRPTTVQVSPQNALGPLDKEAKLNQSADYGAPAFQTQRQDQNRAFVQHLEAMNPGITSKLGDAFVEKATDLASQQAQTAQTGARQMQEATAPLTANVEPAITGAAIREGGEVAHAAQRLQDTDQLWSNVPKNMQHSVIPAAEMARVLSGNRPISIPSDAPPELQQLAQKVNNFVINPAVEDVPLQEQKVLQMVGNLPPRLSYRDTAKLLSTISATKSQLSKAGYAGTPSMTRLSMIEGSLQDSMAGDFSKRIVAGEIPLVSPAAPEGQDALNAARAGTAETKQRFTRGVMGQVLAQGAYGDYKIHNLADVANTVISGNASEPERMGEALDALRSQPEGVQALQDGLISDANRRGVIRPDGTVDLTKFPRWMTPQRQSTLSQFPGLTEKFQNAATMQKMVDDANVTAAQAVKDYQNGIAKKFLGGQDPQLAVRKAVNAQDGGQQLSAIYQGVKHDPDAVQALQGHVTNEVINKFAPESNAAAGQDNGMLAARKFRQYIADNRTPLRQILGGQGMQRLDQIRAALKDAQGAEAAIPGSQTSPLRIIAGKGDLGHKAGMLAPLIGGELGQNLMEGMGHGAIMNMAGAAALGIGTHMFQRVRAAGLATKNDLVSAMMLHPQLLKEMTRKYPISPAGGTAMVKNLSNSLRAVTETNLLGQQAKQQSN